jgi:S-adenosylmethionine:tRNA ribosyltransferase-isomerase
MRAAATPNRRSPDARLLVVDGAGGLQHAARADLPGLLCAGDLVVANDAATWPASLRGRHLSTGAEIELRLAGSASLAPDTVCTFVAVVFGAGDHRMRTEERAPPPRLQDGDALHFGPLHARVERTLDHPRLIAVRFAGAPDAIRAGIARHGRPIQYAHVPQPLELRDVWTRIAAVPVAFEAPSAGFLLDWKMLAAFAQRGVDFATLTHAAGISSTGDPRLDARLPFSEPYVVPAATVRAIEVARARGGRVIALGTTVVRALEHAAAHTGTPVPGTGLATQRIGAETRLRVANAIITGTHEPGTSHYALLRAFTGAATLERISAALEANGYRTHEFGDSVLIFQHAPVTGQTVRKAQARGALVV